MVRGVSIILLLKEDYVGVENQKYLGLKLKPVQLLHGNIQAVY